MVFELVCGCQKCGKMTAAWERDENGENFIIKKVKNIDNRRKAWFLFLQDKEKIGKHVFVLGDGFDFQNFSTFPTVRILFNIYVQIFFFFFHYLFMYNISGLTGSIFFLLIFIFSC